MTRNALLLILSTLTLPAQATIDLKDDVALITGASRGIGKGVALHFAKAGAKVVLMARTEKALQLVQGEIQSQGGVVSFVVGDVTKPEDWQNAVSHTIKHFGRIDILVHNAGIYPIAPLSRMTLDNWNHVINTNLTSAFLAIKAVLEPMKTQMYGRIVFTSSISGPQVALTGVAHYTASKAGLEGLMKTAALELARYNITVNAVSPGNIMTEGLDETGPEHMAKVTSAIPVGRLGSVDEVAPAFVFLASRAASFITGQSMIVDGGQVLPESDALIPRLNPHTQPISKKE